MCAQLMLEYVDELEANIKAGDEVAANMDKWEPSTWPKECGALSPVPEAYRCFVHVHGFNRAFLNAVCPFRDFHKTSKLADLNFAEFLTAGRHDVSCAGQARVKAMDRTQDFERLISHGNRCAEQSGFVCTELALGVTRS